RSSSLRARGGAYAIRDSRRGLGRGSSFRQNVSSPEAFPPRRRAGRHSAHHSPTTQTFSARSTISLRPRCNGRLVMRLPRRLIPARRRLAGLGAGIPFPTALLPWRRSRPLVELENVRRRLELLLAAMYGRHIPIALPE